MLSWVGGGRKGVVVVVVFLFLRISARAYIAAPFAPSCLARISDFANEICGKKEKWLQLQC